ncbi:hypothetical protein GGU10DRAFT_115247 [Lentinula aff. detonsa]|uniref:SP-RING-type domain-containing protein n=1 Tax=Lentinula aff. detonsa TaxID=2804958 RepID=A0AA38NQ56_9AGAR|nr:hypothetical protein GGU10DRAFT_115247 [Lentinula aff. detonsa]
MAVASSSRRKRVVPSSDIEDGLTQRSAREDVVDDDDDDEIARRVVKKEKKSVKGKGRATETHRSEDIDEEDDEDDKIDVANFPDQPLDKSHAIPMKGLASDWEIMIRTIQRTNNMVSDVAVALADAVEGDEGQKDLLDLERSLKELVDIENEMHTNHEAIQNLVQEVTSGTEIDNIIEQYQGNVRKSKKSYAIKTTRQKYAKNETYKNFKQSIYEIEHPGVAMPPVTEFMPKEPGDVSDDDDDLEMGAVTQDYKCPLTLRPLENPVTSEICGHSFSQDAIRGLFDGFRGAKKCPASGCTREFRLLDCKLNKELAKKLKLHTRRLKRKDQEQEVEEIIE